MKTLYEICAQYPFFRKALINAIQLYDDSSKVFLKTILRDVPYLKDCSEETISAIALSMKQDFLEPGAIYFHPGDEQHCISIIQDGQIDLHTTMDNGTPLLIEKLSRGAILGA